MEVLGVGKYLCQQYYKGNLKPSVFYTKESAEWRVSRCVEEALEQDGISGKAWRDIMSHERTKLHKQGIGGRVNFTGERWCGMPIESSGVLGNNVSSSNGGPSLIEIMLYDRVGRNFMKLLRSRR